MQWNACFIQLSFMFQLRDKLDPLHLGPLMMQCLLLRLVSQTGEEGRAFCSTHRVIFSGPWTPRASSAVCLYPVMIWNLMSDWCYAPKNNKKKKRTASFIKVRNIIRLSVEDWIIWNNLWSARSVFTLCKGIHQWHCIYVLKRYGPWGSHRLKDQTLDRCIS